MSCIGEGGAAVPLPEMFSMTTSIYLFFSTASFTLAHLLSWSRKLGCWLGTKISHISLLTKVLQGKLETRSLTLFQFLPQLEFGQSSYSHIFHCLGNCDVNM
jgi:hypothetical protein